VQYLTVLVQTPTIHSLRDLTPTHIPLLNRIREAVYATCEGRFGVGKGKIRLFVHYQPSYCVFLLHLLDENPDYPDHFHVHVVHIEHELAGMTVGQAHLLDDLISLVRL
jgi:m7GpppX diphosphatase